MAEQTRFSWGTIVPVIVGGLLTIVGGWVSNAYQTSFQRRQLLFNSQLTALKEYSATTYKFNNIVVKLEELSTRLPTANLSQESAIQAIEDYRKISDEYLKSRAETGLEELVIEVLFGIKPISQKLDIKIFPNNPAPLADEKIRGSAISNLRQQVDMLKSEIIQYNNRSLVYMQEASKLLRGNTP